MTHTTKAQDLLKSLIGQDLSEYHIMSVSEVYQVEERGIKTGTLGFFKNPDIAKAFANQKDTDRFRTSEILVLSNGTQGVTLGTAEIVTFFDDEEETQKIKEKAIAKLSPEERKILGL